MPGHRYNAAMDADATATTTLTLMQLITPATRRLWLVEFSISGKSITASDIPIRVEWVRQTNAGTTGGALTPAPVAPSLPASLITVAKTFSAEPTDGGVIPWGPYYFSPVGGTFVIQSPPDFEIEMNVSDRLGLRIVVPQSTTVRGNARWLE